MGSINKTETGSVLNFNTYLPKTLDETKISFTPKQSGSGTPSPENVREIVGKNGITVYQQGDDGVTHETSVSFPSITKNLLDSTKRKDGYYIDNTGKEIANAQFGYTTAYTPVEPNETYVLSGNIGNHGSAYGAIYCYDENKNFVNRLGGFKTNEVPHTFTVPSDTYYINIQYFNNQTALTDAQIEKGSTATAYEPFDNTIYGGYVDLVAGEVVAEWTKVDMGDLNWGSYEKCWTCSPSDMKTHTYGDARIADLVCDIYAQGRVTTASQFRYTPEGQLVARNDYKTTGVRDSTYATAADFKTAVTGHYLAYKLAEPIHYPLSPRTLTTLQGVNTMWSDGDSLTISYTDDVVNTYDFRRHISLDTPYKASASGAVASFGTDMVGKMKCKIHFSPKQEGSGTPSPDNVRNISGRSSVKVWRCRENLWDKSTATAQYVTGSSSIQTSDANNLLSDWIKVEPNKTYVYSYKPVIDSSLPSSHRNLWTGCGYYTTTSTGKTARSRTVWTEASTTNIQHIAISIPENCYYIRIGSRHLDMVGAWATFEPYDQTQIDEITFSWGSDPEIGTIYGGYVDCETADLVVEYQKMVITGDENWQLSTWTGNNGVYLMHRETSYDTAVIPFMAGQSYSNMLMDGGLGYYNRPDGSFGITGAGTVPNYTYLFINNTAWGTTVEEYKAKLKELYEAGIPLTIVAPLKTAYVQHYSLTPQSIATLRGSNRIWSDGDSVEVEYYKHTDEPQEYIPAEVLGTGNIAIVTSDGYLIGEEQDFIKY